MLKPEAQNIYATRPRPLGTAPPPPVDINLTKARSQTRNRMVASLVLMVCGLGLAVYLASLIDRNDGLHKTEEQKSGYKPQMISLHEDTTGYTGKFARDETNKPIALAGINVAGFLDAHPPSETNLTGAASSPSTQVPENVPFKSDDELPAMLVSVAAKFIAAKDYGEASIHLKKALASRPGDPEALRLMGTVLLLQENFKEAAVIFENLIKKDPFKPEIFNHLGVACIKLGELDRAYEALSQAIKLNHTYSDARMNLALLHLMRGQFDKVPPLLTPLVAIEPNNVKLRRYLANAYFESGAPYQARIHLQELVRLEPAVGRTYIEVARCYARQEMTQEAMAWITLGRDKCTADELREFLRDPAFEVLYPLQSFQREFGSERPGKIGGRG